MSYSLEFLPSAAAEFPNDNPVLHGGATWVCLEIGGPVRAVVRPVPRPVRAQAVQASVASSPPANADGTESFREEADLEDMVVVGWPDDVAAIVEDWLTTEYASAGASPARDDQQEAESPVTAPACSVIVTEEPAAASEQVAVAALETQELTVGNIDEATYQGTEQDAPTALRAFIEALVGAALSAGATRAAAVIPPLVGVGRVNTALLDEAITSSLVSSGIAERDGSALAVTGAARATLDAWRDVLEERCNDLSACGTTTLDLWGAELLVALRVPSSSTELRRELRRRGVAAFGMLLAA